jgi:UDP-glucuronate 4-epimerase
MSASALNVLVTGGAGFIGSNLCEMLLNGGHTVACLDNFDAYYDPDIKRENLRYCELFPGFRLIQGDILDPDAVDEALTGGSEGEPTTVVHLAGLAGVRPSIERPGTYMRVNGEGTVNVLERARLKSVSHFVMGSTSAVYGATASVPFREDAPLPAQESIYGASKRAAELACATYQVRYGLPVTVLRFFTVYGPRQRPDMAIHKFARMMLAEEPIPVFGDGESARDYTYVGDIVDGIGKAIESPDGFRTFNLGSDRPVKLDHLVKTIAGAVGVEPVINRLPDQPGDVPITWADISAAGSALGYHPSTDLETGIRRFVSWFRSGDAPELETNER